MKVLYTLLLLGLSTGLLAQPTITKLDMPVAGDTIPTRSTILGLGVNYQQTGTNFTWDFSSLNSTGNGADTFITVGSTPLIYQLAFNLPLDPNKANLASPQADISLIPNMPLTDIINFYKSANPSYAMCGFGARVAGIPIPIKFNALDVWYKFPLTAASSPDSCEVSFSQGISGFGYLSIQRKRVNQVDGWGTVITPVASYSALRVKSVVQETDSLYIDSLNIGFAIPRNYTEYKWLASGKGIPVMQVSNQNLVPVYTWIDSTVVSNTLSVDLGIDQTVCEGTTLTLTVNPIGGTPPYFYIWSNGTIGQTITVTPTSTTTYSVTVTSADLQIASDAITITVIPGLTVSITPSPNQTSGCSGPPGIETIFTFSAPPGFSMYSWSTGQSGPNQTSIVTGPPIGGYIGNQDYTVTVSDQNGCTGQDTITIAWDICSAMEENSAIFPGLDVYPNPSNGVLFIQQDTKNNPVDRLEILSYTGQNLCTRHPDLVQSKQSLLTIDLRPYSFSPGLYFLRITSKKGSQVKSIVIQ